jgi:hypothetical protein
MTTQEAALRDAISVRTLDLAHYGYLKNARFDDDEHGVRRFCSDSYPGYAKLEIEHGRAMVGCAEMQPASDPVPGGEYDDRIISVVADVILKHMRWPGFS